LCGKLTRPQAATVDDNVYVRAATTGQPLYVWSPVEGENCQTPLAALEDAQRLPQRVESRSREFTGYAGAVFKSPDLRNLELAQPLPGVKPVTVPEEALRVLGWKDPTHVPGAYR
jgi:hypothetical protein